jgi:hypothetical protein
MGPAHSNVVNRTAGKLVVITFNKADLMFSFYTKLYILEPNETLTVEASADPVGLYVAIVYKASEGYLHFKRWLCLNESEMVVVSMTKNDMDVVGGELLATVLLCNSIGIAIACIDTIHATI